MTTKLYEVKLHVEGYLTYLVEAEDEGEAVTAAYDLYSEGVDPSEEDVDTTEREAVRQVHPS
jgi:hypothetical protein